MLRVETCDGVAAPGSSRLYRSLVFARAQGDRDGRRGRGPGRLRDRVRSASFEQTARSGVGLADLLNASVGCGRRQTDTRLQPIQAPAGWRWRAGAAHRRLPRYYADSTTPRSAGLGAGNLGNPQRSHAPPPRRSDRLARRPPSSRAGPTGDVVRPRGRGRHPGASLVLSASGRLLQLSPPGGRCGALWSPTAQARFTGWVTPCRPDRHRLDSGNQWPPFPGMALGGKAVVRGGSPSRSGPPNSLLPPNPGCESHKRRTLAWGLTRRPRRLVASRPHLHREIYVANELAAQVEAPSRAGHRTGGGSPPSSPRAAPGRSRRERRRQGAPLPKARAVVAGQARSRS